MDIDVKMTVNGKAVSGKVEARTLLVQFLRENLRLTGTHVGCDTTQCGCCTVHVDGKAVHHTMQVRLDGDVSLVDVLSRGGNVRLVSEEFLHCLHIAAVELFAERLLELLDLKSAF